MLTNKKCKKICINITTYHEDIEETPLRKNMDEELVNTRRSHKNNQNGKFICSICFNTRPTLDKSGTEACERKISCPACQRYCGVSNRNTKDQEKHKERAKPNTKTVQTSQTDVTDGLNLLNEVLTVFRSNKEMDTSKENSKTILFKDACVATESFIRNHVLRPKLSVSKVFKFSIEEEDAAHDCFKYTIVSSCQPEVVKSFIKHKSSSVPQMKMDELKKSLKDKTKSKDAIEEVNRMFATVRSNYHDSLDDTNRPMVRSGPRVLPVVKTKNYVNPVETQEANVSQCNGRLKCKCCQTNNYYMSGGDSFRKNEYCQISESPRRGCEETCDKCVYMCCNYKNRLRETQAGFMICECCKSKKNYKKFSKHEHKNDFEVDDSGTSF